MDGWLVGLSRRKGEGWKDEVAEINAVATECFLRSPVAALRRLRSSLFFTLLRGGSSVVGCR